ncbi:exosortase F system-associated membrane protein [Flavobacterium terrigena]|uniref:Exosortase F-associated protein n=1 Tax=Flavobacterium terrigena TaxID=402734 RepID=A0A1H6WR21_9FLAO|nr:exosortase F system-associated protein [Flavobacterium terrigena]SEJ19313.1 exosortase F-associated protein [Flavobacterium terrigena]
MQNVISNKKNLVAVGVLVIALILVRAFESKLFYDPFLEFFHGEIQNKPLPEFDGFKLFIGLFFRYLINSVITVSIIYLLFKEISIVKLTSFLLLGFFVVLMAALFLSLNFSTHPDYLFIFYIRRFLIQPLFLILFVPAFYYQKKVQ